MSETMILCISILSISAIAAGQMGLYYWRAMIATIAAQPISDQACPAVKLAAKAGTPADLRMLLSLYEISPALSGPSSGLRALRAYSVALGCLQRLLPSTANWCRAELAICSRYTAVLFDQHLQRNAVCAAEIYQAL